MLSKQILLRWYKKEKLSSNEVAKKLHCSTSQVNYWMKKHAIQKRSISDGSYIKHNPQGDPFRVMPMYSMKDAFLEGLGLGLYWGEGTKANLSSIRLGNTDPDLLRTFIKFLQERYGVSLKKLRFGLQLFHDHADPHSHIKWWTRKLSVNINQFYAPTISPSVSKGTYKRKSQHGVITIYVANVRLRKIIGGRVEKLRSLYYDDPRAL